MSLAFLDDDSNFSDALAIIADIDWEGNKQEEFGSHLKSQNLKGNELFDAPATFLSLFEDVTSPNAVLPPVRTEGFVGNRPLEVQQHQNRKRKSGVSRRQELETLRDEVSLMETKLSELRQRAKHRTTAPVSMSSQDPPLWKGVAERQKAQCKQAQARNIKLRAKLKSHIRMAKSLIRTLQNREASLAPRPLSASTPIVQQSTQRADKDEFADLLGSMENLFIGTDDKTRSTPVASVGSPHVRDAQIKRSLDGEYLEFEDSRFLPFTVDVVDRAMWRFFREAGISSSHYKHERQVKQEDTIVRTYGVEIDKRSGVTNLHGKQSVHRYFRGNSVVIVRKSIMTPAGAQFVENGWVVISDSRRQ